MLDSGGSILVSRMVSDVLGDRDSLFASAMSAISSVIQEALGEDIRHIRTKNFHLYIGYSPRKETILVIITQEEEMGVLARIDDAIGAIGALGFTVDDLTFSPDAKEEVDRIIMKIFDLGAMPVGDIRDIVNMLEPFVSSEVQALSFNIAEGENLEDKVNPVKPKPYMGSAELKSVIDAFLREDLDYVILNAPKLFLDTDLAKILYAKAALLQLAYASGTKKPDLNYLYGVIKDISDEFARKYLEAELRAFFEVGAYSLQRRLIDLNASELKEKLENGEDEEKLVYLCLLLPQPVKWIVEFATRILGSDTESLNALIQEMDTLWQVLYSLPKDFDSWSKDYGNMRYLTSTATNREAKLRYHHALQNFTVWGLFLSDMDLLSGQELLKSALKYAETYYKEDSKELQKTSSSLKAINFYGTYVLAISILLDLSTEEEKREIIKIYKKRVISIAKWLTNAATDNRIKLDIYYVIMSGIMNVLTKMLLLEGKISKSILNTIRKLAKKELEELWEKHDYIYGFYILDLLTALGYIGTTVALSLVKTKVLNEISGQLEKLAETFKHVPLLASMALLNAARFYSEFDPERSKDVLRRINRFGNFFSLLSKKITNL